MSTLSKLVAAAAFSMFLFSVAKAAAPASTDKSGGAQAVHLQFARLTDAAAGKISKAPAGTIALCYEFTALSKKPDSLRRVVPNDNSGIVKFRSLDSKDSIAVACAPVTMPDGPALPAGGKLYIVVTSHDLNGDCSALDLGSQFVTNVSLESTKETVVDENPLRGMQSTSATSGPTSPLLTLSDYKITDNVPGKPYQTCITRYPGSLSADTYTVVNISITNADDAKKESEQRQKKLDTGTGTVTKAAPVNTSDALPELHTFYRFGFDQGVVYSGVRNKTFAYAPGTTSTVTSADYVTSSSNVTIDPVVFAHWYFFSNGHLTLHGIDPELRSPWPDVGVIFGLSEKNPTSSFYGGLSFEFVRNVSLVIGANHAQEQEIAAGVFDAGPGSSGQGKPPTVNTYKTRLFVGMSFGWSNFLQTAFKGGG